ncbi:hypothetical protein [Leptospira weilii]|nr:hypothetical protein [Leptospira weilii]
MSPVKESVRLTLHILKGHRFLVGHTSHHDDGTVWKKMSYTGKSPWKRIRNYIFPKSGFLISPKKQKPNRTLKLSATDNQPLLFDSESIKTNRSPAYKYVSLNSEIVNQVTRSIVSEAVKETKRSRSEAMRGN